MKNEDAEYIYSLKEEARSILDSAYENGLLSTDLPKSDIEFLEYAADDIYEDDPELGEEIWDFLADSTQGEPLHEDLEFERNAAGKVQVKDVLNGKAKTLTAADAPETYRFAKAVYKTLQDKGKAGDVNKEFNLTPAPDVRKTAADDTVTITPDDGSPAYQIPGREIRKYLESTLGKNTKRRIREDIYDDDYDVADDIDYDVEMTDYDDYNGNGDYEYLTDEDDERTLSDIMPTRRRFFGGDSDGYSEQYRQMLASDDGEYLDTKKGLLTKMEKYTENKIKETNSRAEIIAGAGALAIVAACAFGIKSCKDNVADNQLEKLGCLENYEKYNVDGAGSFDKALGIGDTQSKAMYACIVSLAREKNISIDKAAKMATEHFGDRLKKEFLGEFTDGFKGKITGVSVGKDPETGERIVRVDSEWEESHKSGKHTYHTTEHGTVYIPMSEGNQYGIDDDGESVNIGGSTFIFNESRNKIKSIQEKYGCSLKEAQAILRNRR